MSGRDAWMMLAGFFIGIAAIGVLTEILHKMDTLSDCRTRAARSPTEIGVKVAYAACEDRFRRTERSR